MAGPEEPFVDGRAGGADPIDDGGRWLVFASARNVGYGGNGQARWVEPFAVGTWPRDRRTDARTPDVAPGRRFRLFYLAAKASCKVGCGAVSPLRASSLARRRWPSPGRGRSPARWSPGRAGPSRRPGRTARRRGAGCGTTRRSPSSPPRRRWGEKGDATRISDSNFIPGRRLESSRVPFSFPGPLFLPRRGHGPRRGLQ